MKRRLNTHMIKNGFSVIYLSILTFIIAFQNTDSIWGNGETWVDASVYKYVAWMMDLGYMPYKDTFDHKGPLVYIFFWIGRKFGTWRGVWVPYVILIFVSLLLIFLIFRKFCSPLISCILMLIIFTVLFDYDIYSLSPEVIAIPFMAGGLYIFLDYFLFDSRISAKRLILSGLCFGCVLMIKAQMVSVWAVFCIAVLIRSILNKNVRIIPGFLGFFLLGTCISTIPILCWLVRGGAFKEFIYDYIFFNGKYAALYTGNSMPEIIAERIQAITFFSNKPAVLLALFCCCAMIWQYKENRLFNISYLIYILCSIIVSSLSGRKYGHYGTSLVVAVTYPLAFVAGCGLHHKKEIKRLLTLTGLAYLICIYAMPTVLNRIDNMMNIYIRYYNGENTLSPNLESIVQCVKENTDPDDLISYHGLYDIVYGLSERRSASKYSYQHAFPLVDPEKSDEYYAELEENPPELIIEKLPNDDSEDYEILDHNRMMDFLNSHNYQLAATSSGGTHEIYKRGDQ